MIKGLSRHRALIILLSAYLLTLAIFVFFPRPILDSGNPLAIKEFIRSHSSLFYKILYADAGSVARANYLMLTPFVFLAHLAFPKAKLIYIALSGIGISVIIEISQIYIPGRVADLKDLDANSISVIIGVFMLQILRKFLKKAPN